MNITEQEAVNRVMAKNPNASRGWTTVLAVPCNNELETSTLGVCLSRFVDQDGLKFATHYITWDSKEREPHLIAGNYFETFSFDHSPSQALEAAVKDLMRRKR